MEQLKLIPNLASVVGPQAAKAVEFVVSSLVPASAARLESGGQFGPRLDRLIPSSLFIGGKAETAKSGGVGWKGGGEWLIDSQRFGHVAGGERVDSESLGGDSGVAFVP